MGKPAHQLFVCLAILTAPAIPAAAEKAKGPPGCMKPTAGMGIPHRIKTIAQFNAVRTWTELSMKRAPKYGLWHNARGGSIECRKPERSDYYFCTAKASPCLPPKTAAAEKRK